MWILAEFTHRDKNGTGFYNIDLSEVHPIRQMTDFLYPDSTLKASKLTLL